MRVLAYRALGLGDLLTGVPALRALGRLGAVQLACPPVLAPLALQVVEEVVGTSPFEPLPSRVAGADLAVNLHGRGPQSTAVLAATRPTRLLAWDTEDPGVHERVRWCRRLEQAGVPADPDDLLLPSRGRRQEHAVVHPGAAKPSRRWPADRWAEVVRDLPANDVVVTAGPGETALAEAVVRSAGRGRVVAPDLAGLADVVGTARLLVAPDTGVAHLATALATPSVLLFGPSSPAVWGPPSSGRHRVLWAGRTGDNDAPAPDPGLLALTPADVLSAVTDLEVRT